MISISRKRSIISQIFVTMFLAQVLSNILQVLLHNITQIRKEFNKIPILCRGGPGKSMHLMQFVFPRRPVSVHGYDQYSHMKPDHLSTNCNGHRGLPPIKSMTAGNFLTPFICVLLSDRQYKSTHYAYALLIYRKKCIHENNLNHCGLYCRLLERTLTRVEGPRCGAANVPWSMAFH